MRNLIIVTLLATFSLFANAGRVVKHEHKCPGILKGMDICLNYEMPDEIKVGSENVHFVVQFYTWDSKDTPEARVFVDMENVGELKGELSMSHAGEHMGMPLTFSKVSDGRYVVKGASFVMPGMYDITVDLHRPGQLIKRANLYAYVYPDEN